MDFWENAVMFELERQYAESHDDLPARVFLSSGGEEPSIRPPTVWLRSLLESRDYAGFLGTMPV